jgi:hypothetical protein
MIQPAKIDNHTNVMKPPADWDEAKNGHCGTLFTRADEIDGVDFMHSAWDVEAREALLLLGGAKLILGISGRRHPVVHLNVEQLPETFPPVHMVREVTLLDGRPAVRVDSLYAHGNDAKRVYCEQLIEDGDVPAATAEAMRQAIAFAKASGII